MAEHVIDPWLVIGVAVAFLAGLLSLFAFVWLRTLARDASLKSKSADMSGSERLEYYERQLVDLKIRLDLLEMSREDAKGVGEEGASPAEIAAGLAKIISQLPETNTTSDEAVVVVDGGKVVGVGVENQEAAASNSSGSSSSSSSSNHDDSTPKQAMPAHPSPIDHVLGLITNGITTSRDIQITMKKSREHTSRLLKKMYEDGYLKRNEEGRPYTYTITPKGKEKLQNAGTNT